MWHDVKQNSEDPCQCCGKTWMELRAGKVTGSQIGCVMANYGKAFGDPAKRLAVDIATFELGGQVTQNNYTNNHMERGHEQEPIARKHYENYFFTNVTNGGFYDNTKTGASVDGNVGEDGIIEIKSVTNPYHYECMKNNSFDTKYKWQIFFNLKESGREWVDYVSYCSTFPAGNRLFVKRIYAPETQKELEMIEERLNMFWKHIKSVKEIIANSNAFS